jgi:hypothetical protein
MSITLDIPKTLEQVLSAEATQIGVSLPEYIVQLFSLRPALNPQPKTGSDLVAYWQNAGVVGTRPDIKDSSQYARQIRAKAEKRIQDNGND